MRIALIHALKHSIAPIELAFQRLWPETGLMNLLEDSLSADLAREGVLAARMTERFLFLGRYAFGAGADGILFTCSAFGPCIEAVAQDLTPLPVLKPNEAMIEDVVAAGGTVGLLATFAPTLESMPAEFPPGTRIVPKFAKGALTALDRGDPAEHDRLAVAAAMELTDCDVIALAQFSLARAADTIAKATMTPLIMPLSPETQKAGPYSTASNSASDRSSSIRQLDAFRRPC